MNRRERTMEMTKKNNENYLRKRRQVTGVEERVGRRGGGGRANKQRQRMKENGK